AKVPPEIVRRMNEEINKALQVPEIAHKLSGQGISIMGGSTEAALAFIDSQIDTWAAVVKENHIKPE
ncbi:MAG TPA: tripartite tricarboxylate transporter substrate-binding protein, partial [Ramlibacter sp.]